MTANHSSSGDEMAFDSGRAFDDFEAARDNVYSQFAEAASKIPPMEFGGRKLEIVDVDYDPADTDETHDKYSFGSQAAAIRNRKTLGRRLRGTTRMTDLATGKVLGEKRALLAVVPRVNEDGTMIYRGSRYNIINQQRLKPALYGRVKKNQELETVVNPKKGSGSMHRYIFNPETSVFYVNSGNSRIPLVSLLKRLGVSDDQLKQAWGEEVANKNLAKKDPRAIDKLYERIVPKQLRQPNPTPEYKNMAIKEAIARLEVDPWSSKKLLGIESSKLTPELILASTGKTLNMLRGVEEGDDRDHLAFQTVHSIEDLLAERIKLDGEHVQKNAMRKALMRSNLDSLGSKFLQKQIEATIFNSGLGQMPEGANPLSLWDRATRVTKMGEGGIGSTTAVPMESRDMHTSHQNFLDIARTSESLKVGVDLNFAASARKGKDGLVYAPFTNARTGEIEYLTPEQASEVNVAFSRDEIVPGYALVNKQGKEDYVKPSEVDYIVPSPETAFSGVSTLVPMKGLQPQNRTAMGARFSSQSLPLVNREAPLVQTAVPGTNKEESFYDLHAERVGAVRVAQPGKVVAVSSSAVVVAGPEGRRTYSLHERTPLGRKTAISNRPLVKVGDVVEPGQLLASSNFTDDKGTIAIGLNARVVNMPWRDNYEDAYTVSESFAKRMSSDHSYEYRREADTGAKVSINDFVSNFPSVFSKQQLSKLGDDGVVKVGAVVKEGDPLVLEIRKKATNQSKKLARSGHQKFSDESQKWDHHDEGIVTGVHKNKAGDVVVTVSAASPLKGSDKIAELYGSKGIVRIVPDDEMVQDSEGRPFDVATSDLGYISRKNSSRALAMLLGKAARKRGKPYLLEEMASGEELADFVDRELRANGLEATETVVDPTNGRKIPGVLTGEQYMLKLEHTAESKSHARGVGAYTSDGSPAAGSEDDMMAKRLSNQELGAMVAHGAYEYLRDAALVRGQRNDEYWARFVNGHDVQPTKVPLVYEKFIGYLKGIGVNPVREGSKTRLMMLTDEDTRKLTEGRKIENGETVDIAKDMKPVKGGLFDPAIFGDNGTRFASYELSEPIPHPLMEDVFRKLTGLTKDGFRDVLAGKQQFGDYGTGPQAIQKWLANLNPQKELQLARRQATSASKTKREDAIKRVRYLSGMTSRNIDPKTLMIQSIPIIPPAFRPASKLQGKDTPLIDGMNMLYREMISADQSHRKVKPFSSDTSVERLAAYDAVQAAMGLREPLDPELRQKDVKGIMKRLTGSGPKKSFVQSKLLSGTVDSVGRAVIGPNSKLRLDEIGLPVEQAWDIFEMPILRNLRRRGMGLVEAKEALKNRDQRAMDALQEELATRPIAASRAPVLHKYGKMAYMGKLIKGESLHMNPLVYSAYNADNDGDAMNFHAIISDEAVAEAKKKLLPSTMIFSGRDFERTMFAPNQDHALGLYLASTRKDDARPVVFADSKAAMLAFKRGEIGIGTKVKLLKK